MHADAEFVVVQLARQIRPGEVVFTGVNSAPAVAACLLAKRAYALPFTHLNVAGGIDVTPAVLPASSGDPTLLEGSAAIYNNEDFYDLCARGRLDVAFLGAAQVDAEGHTNVSAIGSWAKPKVRLPGGGGAAVMMPTARRTIVWQTTHSLRGLVEQVDFSTAWGVAVLVTPLAVFTRQGEGRFVLALRRSEVSAEELRACTGFAFDESGAATAQSVTTTEREELERLDGEGVLEALFARVRSA